MKAFKPCMKFIPFGSSSRNYIYRNSDPFSTTIHWARNSVGRVFALHAKSPAFESLPVHFFFVLLHIPLRGYNRRCGVPSICPTGGTNGLPGQIITDLCRPMVSEGSKANQRIYFSIINLWIIWRII